MHGIKGGWVGQTFALAKRNESENSGRKARIRRSKEERKSMVEAFIKKYQKSNDGNFPSLNLTHKEVGGSFYTVREIVREIIQENRVLGPAKFVQDGQSIDQFLEQNPLGTIATEPQVAISLPSKEVDQQADPKELGFLSVGNSNGHEELKVEDREFVNGSQVDIKLKEFDRLASIKLLENGDEEAGKNLSVFAESSSQLINLTSAEVETFPLRSVSKPNDSVDQIVGEGRNEPSQEQNLEAHLESGSDSAVLYEINSREKTCSLEENTAEASASSGPLGEIAHLVDVEVVEDLADPLLKNSDGSFPKENIARDAGDGMDANDASVSVEGLSSTPAEYKQDRNTAGVEARSGVDSESINNSSTRTDSEVSSQEPELKPEPHVQSNGSIQKGINPPLDRINLESWEVASKNSSKQPPMNPIFAVIRAIIVSFLRFWTE
ncbi:hypothetical protein BT93_G1594 [Corymbia citriodora subsp. variegata]|nr:hypothetical protein BT93_G1594 [Corymbia citriodora subsp. variegata]KAF8021207.1 hypothetical protein BT93_G1594 [Corymbia citriodora subsp. variegata]